MPELARTRTTRPARPPRRLRPLSPPHQVVALAALELEAGPVRAYLASVPAIGDRMRRVEALRLRDQLLADGLAVRDAERIVGLRHNVSSRSLRRWRSGRPSPRPAGRGERWSCPRRRRARAPGGTRCPKPSLSDLTGRSLGPVEEFADRVLAAADARALAQERARDAHLDRYASPLGLELLRAGRARELLSLADLPRGHGWGADLDRLTGGGLAPGEIVGIGAPGSGAGKTTFLMQLVDGLALRSADHIATGRLGPVTPVVIVSEMPADQLAHRTIARELRVSPSILMAGQSAERWLGRDEVDRVFARAEEFLVEGGPLASLPAWHTVFRPNERATFLGQLEELVAQVRERAAHRYGREVWPVVALDPIQRWQNAGVSEVEALNVLCEDLDATAEGGGWLVLLTSDTNKPAATGKAAAAGEDMGVGSFRGSMKLFHTLDLALLVDGGAPVDDPGRPRDATVKVTKNRRGPLGAVSFDWFAGRGLGFTPNGLAVASGARNGAAKAGGPANVITMPTPADMPPARSTATYDDE